MVAWKPVPGWNYYEVSDDGQVRSLDRIVPYKNGRTQKRRGQLLKQMTHRGYKVVRLREAKHDKTVKVHVLVLLSFVGPKPPGMEGRHLNGNAEDNSLSNLRWGTKSENNLDRVRHGTHQNAAKLTCPQNHVYDYIDPKTGSRKCKTCRKKQMQDYYERHKK